jgi:hypothetical protein
LTGGEKRFFTGIATSAAFSLLLILTVLSGGIPLGAPGEWCWNRTQNFEIPVFETISVIIFFCAATAIAFLTDFRSASIHGKFAGVILILLCGLVIDYQILLSGRIGINENMIGIIDKYTSGYMTAAATIDSPAKYFSDFIKPQNGRRSTPEHIDVHPPGNILISWLALKACRESGALRKLIEQMFPDGSIEKVAAENIGGGEKQAGTLMAYAAALLLLLMLAGISLAKGLILLSAFVLAKNKFPYAGMTALTLLAVPGAILFAGHYDPLFFFITSLCCLFFALAATGGKLAFLWAGLCGFVLGIGAIFTLAYGTMIILFFAFFLITAFASGNIRKNLTIAAAAAAGGLAVALLCFLSGFNIIGIFLQCLHGQARFHAATGRSAIWAALNFFDFLLFLGPIGFFLPFFLLAGKIAAVRGKGLKAVLAENSILFTLLYAAMLFLMCLSPLTRGEMGRLLIFYMPVPLVLACAMISEQPPARRTAILICIAGTVLMIQTMLMRVALKLVIAI